MRGVRSTLLKLPFHGLQALTQINPANHSFDASFRNNDAITIVRRVWQDYTEISSRNLRPPCLWYEDEPVPFRPDARAEYPCATWRPPSCPRRACRSISLPPPSSGRGGRSSWRRRAPFLAGGRRGLHHPVRLVVMASLRERRGTEGRTDGENYARNCCVFHPRLLKLRG